MVGDKIQLSLGNVCNVSPGPQVTGLLSWLLIGRATRNKVL